MSYSDFINSLGYGFTLLFDTISRVSSSLLNNYIIITLLGLSIFSFVIYSLVDILFSVHKKKKSDLDNYGGGNK